MKHCLLVFSVLLVGVTAHAQPPMPSWANTFDPNGNPIETVYPYSGNNMPGSTGTFWNPKCDSGFSSTSFGNDVIFNIDMSQFPIPAEAIVTYKIVYTYWDIDEEEPWDNSSRSEPTFTVPNPGQIVSTLPDPDDGTHGNIYLEMKVREFIPPNSWKNTTYAWLYAICNP